MLARLVVLISPCVDCSLYTHTVFLGINEGLIYFELGLSGEYDAKEMD